MLYDSNNMTSGKGRTLEAVKRSVGVRVGTKRDEQPEYRGFVDHKTALHNST
jgi:hypothetical protein